MTHDEDLRIKALIQAVDDLQASDVYKAYHAAKRSIDEEASENLVASDEWQDLQASDVYKAFVNAMKEAKDEAWEVYEKALNYCVRNP